MAKNHFGRGIRLQFYLPSLQTKEIEAMNLRRLFKNQFFTLLTQGEKHESLFDKEIHGHTSQPPLPEGARRRSAGAE
jgi:hypothetical protein